MHGQHILNKNYSQKMLEHARNYFLWGDYILCLCKPLCAKHHMRWKVQLGPGCLSSSTQPHHTELTSDQPPAMRHRSCLPAASGKIEKRKGDTAPLNEPSNRFKFSGSNGGVPSGSSSGSSSQDPHWAAELQETTLDSGLLHFLGRLERWLQHKDLKVFSLSL